MIISYPPSAIFKKITSKVQGSTAAATVHGAEVQAFCIGPYPRQSATGEDLKDILHDYGVSMTGNKEQLLEKLAAIAARKYHDRLPEIERFFAKNRFVRMCAAPKDKHTADTKIDIKRYIGDFLLVGLSLLVLISLANRQKR